MATTVAADPAVVDALVAVGLDGRLLDHALRIPGLTPPLVLRIGRWCDERGKGAPIVLAELHRTTARAAARARLASVRAATDARTEADPPAAERQQALRQRQTDADLLASLDDATVEGLKREFLAGLIEASPGLTEASRRFLADRNPRAAPMAVAIADLARRHGLDRTPSPLTGARA
jgi:hypothetical protein